MKRSISLLLVLVMVLSFAPAVRAYESPAVSDNMDDHFYVNAQRWTDPIKSTMAAEDGGYLRVEYIDDSIVVEHYDADLNFVSGQELAAELPVYGGVYICDDYNFVVTGQNNPDEDDSVEVFRITRYTKDWEKVDHASLFGANTYIPFDGGTVRMDRSGDILYIRTCHEMYAASDGTHHQANVMIAVRISDMTVTDSLTKVWNSGYGYVSHSFNQFVRVDGETLLAVDHGDAYPRSVCLFKYPYEAGSETFYGKTTMVNVLNIVDSTYHYNDTGVSVGGFECSSTHYLVAGCSYDQIESANLKNVHRNIFVTATPKDDFTDDATEIHWLTAYTAEDNVTVSPPHMVKVSNTRFMLLWTENGDLKYCYVDNEGQLIGEITDAEGSLSDCVPILDGNQVRWYVTDNSAPVFYELPAFVCEHSYSSVVTEPTCTEGGCTTHTCAKCGESHVDSYTDALGHSFVDGICIRCCAISYDFFGADEEVTRGKVCYLLWAMNGCPESSDITLSFVDVSEDDYYYDAIVWAVENGITNGTDASHFGSKNFCNRAQVVTFLYRAAGSPVPTLDTNPFTDVDEKVFYYNPVLWSVEQKLQIANVCSDKFGVSSICTYGQILGDEVIHFEVSIPAVDATCTKSGLTEGKQCSACDEILVAQKEIPAHGHSYESVITEPNCTEGGHTTHTCVVCGDSYTDTPTAALGHDDITDPGYPATCTEDGLTDGAHCGRCNTVLTEQTVIPATGHYYKAAVTEPTCEVEGYTTHTCACGDSYSDSFTAPLGHDWHGLNCRRCDATRENPFTDTNPLQFYFEPVLWAVENGITNGATATTFNPNGQCQRGQVVTFLWRAKGSPEPESTDNPFVDVKEGSFYYKAVLWAVENGITNGLDATHFGPNAYCNRAQVVTFLWRTVGCPEAEDPENPFGDVKQSGFYYDAVLWAVEKGITNGISATEFGVNAICNRAQIVTFLYRTFA